MYSRQIGRAERSRPLGEYMGLFARCKVLIDSGVLDPHTFERQYGYRLRHLIRYRGARIRTEDLGHPKAARYQAAPHPDRVSLE
jgi:hypothetical protein